MRRYVLIGAAAAMLAIPALAFGRATTPVEVGDNFFKPKAVTKTVGTGDVHWRWGTNGRTLFRHNVRQDKKLFYSGRLTESNPDGFTVTPSAGKFHYYCELHGSLSGGMAGTLKVRPEIFDQKTRKF